MSPPIPSYGAPYPGRTLTSVNLLPHTFIRALRIARSRSVGLLVPVEQLLEREQSLLLNGLPGGGEPKLVVEPVDEAGSLARVELVDPARLI